MERTTKEPSLFEKKYSLREYFVKYLKEIRRVSNRTVAHYVEALDSTVSRYLVDKRLVKNSFYEVIDLENLENIKEVLMADAEFHALDDRGHRMYSAAINRYLEFAEGKWFEKYQNTVDEIKKFDEPLPLKDFQQVTKIERVKRSYIIKQQVEEAAHYLCEFDNSHSTFIVNQKQHQYMEGHHAIPLHNQTKFENSLDVYANVVCLCPICHRLLHYGREQDKEVVLDKIYEERSDRLAKSGILLSKREFFEFAN